MASTMAFHFHSRFERWGTGEKRTKNKDRRTKARKGHAEEGAGCTARKRVGPEGSGATTQWPEVSGTAHRAQESLTLPSHRMTGDQQADRRPRASTRAHQRINAIHAIEPSQAGAAEARTSPTGTGAARSQAHWRRYPMVRVVLLLDPASRPLLNALLVLALAFIVRLLGSGGCF